jgi:hypothetical protein
MKMRAFRGRMVPIKGGTNIQLCAREIHQLRDLLSDKMAELEPKAKNNKLYSLDLTYFRRIYSKLTKQWRCVHCGEWVNHG